MATTAAAAASANPSITEALAEKPTVVIDLGRKKRGQVKKLRKGQGRLMDRVHETVDSLRASQTIDGDSQVVVVVVAEKKKAKGLFG